MPRSAAAAAELAERIEPIELDGSTGRLRRRVTPAPGAVPTLRAQPAETAPYLPPAILRRYVQTLLEQCFTLRDSARDVRQRSDQARARLRAARIRPTVTPATG